MKMSEFHDLKMYSRILDREDFHGLMTEVFLHGYLRSDSKFSSLNREEISVLFDLRAKGTEAVW